MQIFSCETLINEAKTIFAQQYGCTPLWVVAAPGRVNLIGEHTDYNDGFVFPMAIERYTVIAASPITASPCEKGLNGTAAVFSTQKNETAPILIDGKSQLPDNVVWSSYIQGVVQYAVEAGHTVKPFQAVVHSNVPLGGGLSSSASLEVAAATLMEVMSGQQFEPVEKALLCQKAEHHYAKMPCGIMDQFISTMGQQGHAMLLDCRSQYQK